MSDTDPEIRRTSDRLARRTPRPLRMRRRLLGVAAFLASVAAVAAVVLASLHVHLPFGLSSTPPAHSATTGATGTTGPTGARRPSNTSPSTVCGARIAGHSGVAQQVAAVPFGTGGALFFGGLDASGSPIDARCRTSRPRPPPARERCRRPDAYPPSPRHSAPTSTCSRRRQLDDLPADRHELQRCRQPRRRPPPMRRSPPVGTKPPYVIGGYTGSAELDTIVAYTPVT